MSLVWTSPCGSHAAASRSGRGRLVAAPGLDENRGVTDASQLPGLFGFLATRSSRRIPRTSPRKHLRTFCARLRRSLARSRTTCGVSPPIPGGLHYVTQAAADDRAIPDLAGIDASGRSPLLVEAKFWAGLTDQQPVAYLARLPEDETALLLFIVPSVRLELLWTEVLGRAGAIVTERGSGEYRYCSVGGQRVMAMTSWRALLLSLSEAATSAGDRSARSDLEQLHGLCDRMDSEAFIPLASADLSAGVGLRILHYGDIVTRAVDLLVTRGVASLKSNGGSLSSSAAAGWWGRYFAVGPVVCLLRFVAGPRAR